jgi:hypothetical protein
MAIYRVLQGDTPMSIAHWYTGEPTRMSELVEANADRPLVSSDGWITFASLVPGDRLRIPPLWGSPIGLGGVNDDGVPSTDELVATGTQAGIDYAKSSLSATQLARDVATGAAIGGSIATVIAGWTGIAPVVGAYVGAFVAFAIDATKWLSSVTSGQCTITIYGQDTSCEDYANNVVEAARWLQANAQSALEMTPDQFAQQTHILVEDFRDWFGSIGSDYQATISNSPAFDPLMKLPGARSLLRIVQVPIAAASAAAFPTLWPLFKFTMVNTFPALTDEDMHRIAEKTQPIYAATIGRYQSLANAVFKTKPTAEQVHAQYPEILPVDATAIADNWKSPNSTTITIHGESAAGKLATGAVVAAGLTTAAIWGYSAYRGVTFLNTAKSLYGDVVNFFKR